MHNPLLVCGLCALKSNRKNDKQYNNNAKKYLQNKEYFVIISNAYMLGSKNKR